MPAIDCSPDAPWREWLKDLLAKKYSPVKSVSDRSRSVTYKDAREIDVDLRDLLRLEQFCLTGAWPAGRRTIVFLPYNKFM